MHTHSTPDGSFEPRQRFLPPFAPNAAAPAIVESDERTIFVLPAGLEPDALITITLAGAIYSTLPSRLHDPAAAWRFAADLAATVWTDAADTPTGA